MYSEDRVELAIEVLKRGESFSIGELNFAPDLTDANKVLVSFSSSFRIEFASKTRVRVDLDEAIKILSSIKESYLTFKHFLSEKKVVFRIVDDYGMGGTELAILNGDKITFAEGLPD